MNSNRVVFLDYLRIVACFMVMLVHACEPFYLGGEGTYIANSYDAFWVTIFDSALRCAVPLFIMTSSYLLFPLKVDSVDFFRRRVVRVLVPLTVWSILYALVPMWGCGEGFDIVANLRNLLLNFNMHSGHLWFVYMLIGVYILMPLLSPWIEKVSKCGEQIFIAAWAFTTLVPFLNQVALTLFGRAEVYGVANWNEFGSLYYISGFIGYVVVAHYIRTYVDWSWRKTLTVAVPMWIAGYAIAAIWFWEQIPTQYPVNQSIDLAVLMEQSWRFCSTGVAMTAIAVFLVFKKINCSGWFYNKVVLPVSKVSYGMYLMHMFALVAILSNVSTWGLATPWTMLISTALAYVVCAVVALFISKLPFGKYIVG
ncbi:MAG: acyltransferase [Alistipes sp.]|nr:acyltransferase [Alistipes sp.]